MKERVTDFTQGGILGPLMRFMLPVLFAMLLQDLYGAVDLFIVGRFALTADVSGVTTGAQIMSLVMNLAVGFSMGVTILLGQQIGRGEREKGGKVVGARPPKKRSGKRCSISASAAAARSWWSHST